MRSKTVAICWSGSVSLIISCVCRWRKSLHLHELNMFIASQSEFQITPLLSARNQNHWYFDVKLRKQNRARTNHPQYLTSHTYWIKTPRGKWRTPSPPADDALCTLARSCCALALPVKWNNMIICLIVLNGPRTRRRATPTGTVRGTAVCATAAAVWYVFRFTGPARRGARSESRSATALRIVFVNSRLCARVRLIIITADKRQIEKV